MPRATTTERSRAMRRTRNGILIPDVPIMAGGNLPNAVKGVSAGVDDKPLDPLDVHCPFFIKNESADVAQIKIYKRGNDSPSIEIEISQNAKDWETIGTTSTNGLYINILPNSRLYLRAEISSWASSSLLNSTNSFSVDNNYSIGGNIFSLLYGEEFNGQTEFKNESANAFIGLFYQQSNLVDASSLQLNAIIVPMGAYDSLFHFCNNLESAPIIKGQTFGNSSCNVLFNACGKINRIECHATNPTSQGFFNWVQNVAENGTFVKKRGVSWPSGISGIPTGWTVEEID